MQSLGEILRGMKIPAAPSPNTGDCWCEGKGGRIARTLPAFGPYAELQHVWDKTCPCEIGVKEEERKKALLAEQAKWDYAQQQRMVWGGSQIPHRFTNFDLRTCPFVKTNPELVRRLTCPTYDADNPEAYDTWAKLDDAWRGSWYFYGGYGVGKTGLAVCLAREFVRGGLDVPDERLLFVGLPALLGELRSTYNNHREDAPTEKEIIQRYSGVRLLVLDDLGAEQVTGSGWVEDRLYQIIGQRHDEERFTIFTSNLSLVHLAKRIGERITWRILEMCGPEHVVEVKGPNLRDIKRLPG
mgnify:CR=1 FL=1